MTVETRQRIERAIVRRVITDCLANIPAVEFNVDNGGNLHELAEWTRDIDKLMPELLATDEAYLQIRIKGQSKYRLVFFVYGNYGYDVISDYNTSLEPHLEGALDLARDLENHDVPIPLA